MRDGKEGVRDGEEGEGWGGEGEGSHLELLVGEYLVNVTIYGKLGYELNL